MGPSLRITITLAAVLGSAVLVWWRGRALAALVGDPAFSERRLASVRTARLELAATTFVILAVWWSHGLWVIPLLLAARAAAALPLRRAIYGETWAVAAYLWFFTRLIAGVYGFWLLLAVAPYLVTAIGAPVWAGGTVLALLLLVWHERYPDVLRRVLGAEPLDDPRLAARVAQMAAACNVANPRLDCVPLHGGVIANALALPSFRQPGILFTETLLARFDHDEVVAICAHEVAHLESFNPRYLRRWRLIDCGAILTGAFILPSLDPGSWVVLMFPAGVAGILAFRGRHGQKNETASDIRAVELTGDGEALVRALVKLNAIARFPRRWDTDLETRATHPSLARRIQAIRRAAGAAGDSLAGSVTCMSPDATMTAVFGPGRIRIAHGDASEHVLSYHDLSELRVAAARAGAPSLVAVDRSGRRWEMPLVAADVPRVQATLDRVDGQLAPRREARPVTALPRAAAAVAAMTMLASGHVAMLAASAIALFRPAPRLLGAAGASATISTWLIVRDVVPIGKYDPAPTFASIAAGCAAVLLAFAYTRRHTADSRMDRILVAGLGAGAVTAWGLVLLTGIHPVHLHDGIRQWPAAPILAAACAGALASSRAVLTRLTCAAAAVAGLTGCFFGSATFLARFSDDPFVARGRSAGVRTLSGPPAAQFSLPHDTVDVRLSPTALSVAVSLDGDDEQSIFQIGRAGGTLQEVSAADVVFVSDTHALVLRHEAGSASVSAVLIDDPERPLWRHELPHVAVARLGADVASGRWGLLGLGPANDVVRVEGRSDGAGILERRWRGAVPSRRTVEPVAAPGDSAIVQLTQYERRLLDGTRFWEWSPLLTPVYRYESRFEVWSRSAPALITATRLDADCQSDDDGSARAICWAFDGHRTSFFSLDAHGLRPITAVDGEFVLSYRVTPGWLAGWRASRPAALRLDGPEVIQVAVGQGFWVAQLVPLGGRIAAMVSNGEEVAIRVYDVARRAPLE